MYPHVLRYISLDSLLHVLLAERRRELCFLERRWSTPFVSDIRFRVACQEATKTAQILSGDDPALVLHWMDPTLATTVVTVEDDGEDDGESLQLDPPSVNYTLESDILIAEDELESGDDLEDDSLIEKADADVLWALPVSV